MTTQVVPGGLETPMPNAVDHEAQVFDTLDRFVAALTAGDPVAAGAIFTDDAVVWHNYDEIDQPKDAALAPLAAVPALGIRYEIIRRYVVPDGCIQQHVICRTSPGGTTLRVPVAALFFITDGRITRIEEYMDTAQAAAIVGA